MSQHSMFPGENSWLVPLVKRIGATIAGVKPAELLNIPYHYYYSSQWQETREALTSPGGLEIVEVKKKDNKVQVLFYHRDSLGKVLGRRSNYHFLVDSGYPREYTLERYLGCLLERLRGEEFPHEIGVFLGYPLKDVKGFLGHPSLKLVEIKGWRIYGHRELSYRTYNRFREARKRVEEMLEGNMSLENILRGACG